MSVVDIEAVRRSIVAIIREVNSETEREVLAAGSGLHAIVDTARAHIESSKHAMQRVSGAEHSALAAVLTRQSTLVSEHVGLLRADVERHSTRAQTTLGHVATISEAARNIAGLTRQAHILSINAQIEAAHVAEGSGFRVIAREMRGLAGAIAKANRAIQEVAAALAAVLPGMAEDASALAETTDEFAGKANSTASEISERVAEIEESTATLVSQGDRVIESIIADSHGALSHLQFQDVCAQRLLGIDRELRQMQVALHLAEGDEAAAARATPEVHAELGGGVGAAGGSSGEVLLF